MAPDGAGGAAQGARRRRRREGRDRGERRRRLHCGGGRRGGRGRCGGRGPRGSDDAELAADGHRGVGRHADLEQHAGDGRRDLGVDLVGGDLDQRLVHGHLVADLLEPAGDRALGDALAQGGEQDRRRGARGGCGAARIRDGCGSAGGEYAGSGSGWAAGRMIDGAGAKAGWGAGGASYAGAGTSYAGAGAGRRRRGLRGVADDGELAAHRHDRVLAGGDPQEHARRRRGDLGVDLVGGDLEQRLVGVDVLTLGLQPPGDRALGDALAQLGHRDGDGHGVEGLLRLVRCGAGCGECGAGVRCSALRATGSSCPRQPCACSGLPARAMCASPIASDRVGWAWMSEATSSACASQL